VKTFAEFRRDLLLVLLCLLWTVVGWEIGNASDHAAFDVMALLISLAMWAVWMKHIILPKLDRWLRMRKEVAWVRNR
jgi:hypothetical protein